MKQLSKLFLAMAIFFSVAQVMQAQTAYMIGIGGTEPLDSIKFYDGVPAGFGGQFPNDTLLTGLAAIAKDLNGKTTTCDSITQDLTGQIAIIDRGVCAFDIKCYRAWQKGAKAIIVVNNSAAAPVIMGGSTFASKITVPCMMVSLAQGNAIRAKIAANSGVYVLGMIRPNEDVFNPYAITPGTWSVDSLIAGGGALADTLATHAAWFTYKPEKSGKMSLSSCGKGENTSLFVYELVGNNILPLASSLSACAKNATDLNKEAAALANVPAKAGTTYYIEWNDLNSKGPFDFDLSFVKNDSVNLTVKVDMKNETVDAAGVHLAGAFQGWDPAKTKCTNVTGTSIWTKTLRVKSDEEYKYKFINGNAWGKDESVTGPCAVAGGGDRVIKVATDNVELSAVCFKTCDACPNPPLVCDPNKIICDGFDTYTLGKLNPQATHWDVWDEDAAAGDGLVVADNSFSGKNALLIDGKLTPTQDVVFKSGNQLKGNYNMKWKMYIPAGSKGYYNIQHDIKTGAHVWASDVFFYKNGGGTVDVAGVNVGKFTYENNKWFDVSHNINIDKDTATVTVGGKTIGWKWSKGSNGTATVTNKLFAGVNFYADSSFTKYYIDDVQLINIPPPTYDVTFSVDMKGQTVDATKPHIAGNFQKAAGFPGDWDPATTVLTNTAGTVWSYTAKLPAGKYEYKFINGSIWANDESMSGQPCDVNGGNRGFEVKDKAVVLNTVCFKRCFACGVALTTFIVDLSLETKVSTKGVTLAGNLQKAAGFPDDWTPGVVFMKDNGKKVYSVTLGVPAGSYEYKFVNGTIWTEDETTVTGACSTGSNRKITIGTVDTKLDTVCFRNCATCKKVLYTNDETFSNAMNVYPNPAQDEVNMTYAFGKTTTLTVKIVNTLGQIVLAAELPSVDAGTAIFDTHNLTNGLYFLQVTDNNNRQSVKHLMIQK